MKSEQVAGPPVVVDHCCHVISLLGAGCPINCWHNVSYAGRAGQGTERSSLGSNVCAAGDTGDSRKPRLS